MAKKAWRTSWQTATSTRLPSKSKTSPKLRGKVLKDLNINIVNIDFNLETNTVFAPGIQKASPNIIPNDEVVVIRNDEVVGVGKAILTGREMEECSNGIGVKIKHRVK